MSKPGPEIQDALVRRSIRGAKQSIPEVRQSIPGRSRHPHRRQVLAGLGIFASGIAASSVLAPAIFSPSAFASEQDLRFRHAFGETVLPKPARRVVSLGYTTQDPLLALGIVPVGIREWYGNLPHAVWPWATPYLGDNKPTVLSGEVSVEIVASLAPDLIVGIGSGISRAEYDLLSQIAPVLMHPEGNDAYGTPWDVVTRLLGRATGMADKAEQLVAGTRGAFTSARKAHPDWEGETGVCAYHTSGETGAFVGTDTRATFLKELGLVPPGAIASLSAPDSFFARLSPEDLSPLDADLLIWVSSFDTVPDIVALPMRKTLNAHWQGREVFAGPLIAGALSFGSVLSLPFALKALEEDIALALDGNPDTPVPSSVKAGLTR